MTRMHNPPHPGEVLQDTVLSEITVTEFAKRLGVSRVAPSRVVNGRAAVSAELAIRLAAALGGSAESWLQMQVAYDLWRAQKKRRPKNCAIEVSCVRRDPRGRLAPMLSIWIRRTASYVDPFQLYTASLDPHRCIPPWM